MWPVNPLPVQAGKVQAPLVRADTLSRPRLNGWLDRAARARVALVIAEAGFGKTTFLGDWSSQTPRRTSWYRLEPDDRDWLTLIRHLVAGGREVDEEFAPETYRLLSSLGPGGPTKADLIASLAGEMAEFGTADNRGFSVILDDYHSIEASEETDPVIAALLEATGPGFSLIISARTTPELPPVRLRGRTAVQRLDGDALRFDVPETDALFRDAYGIPLEPDVVRELVARTEGWAALLSLVRTRLEERPDPDPRALVAQLSATDGDLYDFLAEEVLGDLAPDLHEFLMRTSILGEVSARTASLVDDHTLEEIESAIAVAESMGLLVSSGRGAPGRFHPLVRDFLIAKLEAKIGREALRQLHRSIAEALEATDWLASALHYRSANMPESAARVVDEAIPQIIGAGAFEAAIRLLDGTAGPADRAGALIVRSRIEFIRGNLQRAISLAETAAAQASPELAGIAMLNLAALEGVAGFPDRAITRAEDALKGQLGEQERRIAEASLLLRGAQIDGDLADVADRLRQLANEQEFAGLSRYAAISHLNLAGVLIWLGDPQNAIRSAVRAEMHLNEHPDSVERVSALAARATALMQLRQHAEAELVTRQLRTVASPLGRLEADLEIAQLETLYGDIDMAREAIERVGADGLVEPYRGLWELIAGAMALRVGDAQRALDLALRSREHVVRDVAGKLRTEVLVLRASMALGLATVPALIEEASRLTVAQGSRPGRAIVALLASCRSGGPIGSEVASLSADQRHVLSYLAEEICDRLDDLSPGAASVVNEEARSRPRRWRPALRLAAGHPGRSRLPAAWLLADVGAEDDALFLRGAAKSTKSLRDPAAAITRRLAPRALLRDLGVMKLELDGKPAERTTRRKAMALLCLLASKPRFAATRDEALEALWPDYSPEMGVNSLHQAIYYVRRMFDAEYREGLSASYLAFDGEVLSLDRDLVDSDSHRCWRLLQESRTSDPHLAEQVLGIYQGRFAIDFMYEDWASDYRETLHAAVLSLIEAAMDACYRANDLDRASRIGATALALDPSADSIELRLIQAYKAAGRPAAAAEQYAHYAATQSGELGIQAPSLDSI